MGLFDLFSKSKNERGEKERNEEKTFKFIKEFYDWVEHSAENNEARDLYDLQLRLCDGVDADELPNGSGDFAAVSNPIPCRTVFGSIAYLSLLRALDGRKVEYERIGSFRHPVSEHPIDGYKISHPIGRELGVIFISPYHKRNSKKAPKGFVLKTNYAEPFYKYGYVAAARFEKL